MIRTKNIGILSMLLFFSSCSEPPPEDSELGEENNTLPSNPQFTSPKGEQDPEAYVDESIQQPIANKPEINHYKFRDGYIKTILVSPYEDVTINNIVAPDEGCSVDYIVQEGIFHEEYPFVMKMGKKYEIGTNCDTQNLEVETENGVIYMRF